jgi:hypothetical protein
MKVSKRILTGLLMVMLGCLLVVAAILLLRTPLLVPDPWSGVHPIHTTTPTLTLFPAQGWWTSLPTAPGLEGLPTPVGTKTPTFHP